jgi:acetyltransferase-like isoleucine patch superfamily enzyme
LADERSAPDADTPETHNMSMTWKLLANLSWKYWGPVIKARCRSGGAKAFRKRKVGKNSYVDPSVQIFGWEHVTVGANAALSEGSWLNASARDGGYHRIIIGDFCHIGRRNYFCTGGLIHIKDFGFTGLDCHFLGCGHNIDSPMIPYAASGLSTGAPIEIGVNCWLTTSVTVLEGVHIGCGSVIGARSLVTDRVPRFSIAIGNPCGVVKRVDFKNNRWIAAQQFTDELAGFMPKEEEYLAHCAAIGNRCGRRCMRAARASAG